MERSESVGRIRPAKTGKSFSLYDLALPFSERRALLMVADILIGALAALIANWAWQKIYPQSVHQTWSIREQVRWLSFLGAAWLVLIGVNEGYDLKVASRPFRIFQVLLLSLLELTFLYLSIFFIWGRPSWRAFLSSSATLSTLPRITPALFIVTAFLLSLAWRFGFACLFSSAFLRRRAIAIGCGIAGQALVHDIRQAAPYYEIIGFVDDDPGKLNQSVVGLPVLGDRHDLVRLVRKMGVNEVVLAITHQIHSELIQALIDCYELGVEVRPMPVVYEEMLGRIPVEHLGLKWFMAPFWSNAGMPTLYRAIKRVIDIVLALMGLSALGLFLPFILLAGYLDSPGPMFYRQKRVGKGGRPFYIFKLRSMVLDAEQDGEAVWATEDDPRVTRVGRFLRRTRLDELPQLVNVLRGEMSIVGPRPERPQFVAKLQDEIPFYRSRLSVKPGITGWAQIKYGYGNTVEDALIKLQYDLYYVKRQSLLLDALIMLRTIKVVLSFRGT